MSQPTVVTLFRPPEQAAAPANGTGPAVPKSETMTITPQIAQEWVTLNTRNRPVRYARAARFARDMKDGTWVLNGETVKIASDGTILDGQHRLYACIQASVAFETFVIRGLPADAQDTIDTGAARSMGDQFDLRGEAHAKVLAAVTRWAYKWLHGERGTGRADTDPTHAEMSALLDAEPRLREAAAWADGARASFRSVSGSVWGMAWMLLHGSDHLAADVFLDKVLTGADLGEGHPALAFRNRIWKAREGGERLNQHEQLAYLIIAWNAFQDGRQISRLQGPKGKLTPANFPEPK